MFTDFQVLELRDHKLFHKVVKDKATIKVSVVKFKIKIRLKSKIQIKTGCLFPVLISLSRLSNQSYKHFVCYRLDDALHCLNQMFAVVTSHYPPLLIVM